MAIATLARFSSGYHPTRTWVRALAGRVAFALPDGWRICGENTYGRHSIAYDRLPSYFRATALHEAAWRNDTALVDLLLAAGADRTLRDRANGAAPAGWADHGGHAELAERLDPRR